MSEHRGSRSVVPTGWAVLDGGEREREWRLCDASRRRDERRLVVVAVVAGWVLAQRRLHPLTLLSWLLLLAVVVAPFLLLALCIGLTRRQHLRWRSWRRTSLLVLSWVAAVGLAYLLAALALPAALFLFVPAGAVAWMAEGRLRAGRDGTGAPTPGPRDRQR